MKIRRKRETISRRGRPGNRAVSGFFEDIPALIVVTIGLAIFITSSSFAIYQHTKFANAIENTFKYFDIMKALRNYDGLCYIEEGNANRLEGFYDAKKVYYLSVYNISMDIPELGGVSPDDPTVPDYMKTSDDNAKVREWQLIIQDFSEYPFVYTKEVNNTKDMTAALKRTNKDVFQSIVNIRVSDEEIHVAKMSFTVFQWKDDASLTATGQYQ